MPGGSGGRARPGKAANKGNPEKRLKPEGEKDGCKRTPLNAYDTYKGRSSYRVEKVVLKRLQKGEPEFFVKWVDIPPDGNTWEPLANLAATDGENAICSYEEEQRLLLVQVRVRLLFSPTENNEMQPAMAALASTRGPRSFTYFRFAFQFRYFEI